MTKHGYLLGYPLKVAAGPVVMQAACDYLNLDVQWENWELEDASKLPEVVSYIRSEEVLGMLVTMPYKESIAPFLDEINEEAQKIGAINPVYKDGGKLIGHNADVVGFSQSLTREGGFNPKDKRVTMLGAGGAARACSYSLAKSGVKAITIVNRTLSKGQGLVPILKSMCPDIRVIGYDDPHLKETIQNSELLLDCTPFGMRYSPLEGKSPMYSSLEGESPIGKLISRGQMVYDVVYKPLETPFLKMAREAGAQTMNGSAWLVYGQAFSFQLFTHQEPPIDVMFDAMNKLAEKHGW